MFPVKIISRRSKEVIAELISTLSRSVRECACRHIGQGNEPVGQVAMTYAPSDPKSR